MIIRNHLTTPRRGNELSAQGIALGRKDAQPTPCKGKSTMTGQRPAAGLWSWLAMASLLLMATITGCSDDITPDNADSNTDQQQPLALNVSEQPWEGESVSVTRSNESMLEGLKAVSDPATNGEGFGVYSTTFSLTNKQVTWNSSVDRWNYGNTLFWKNKLDVSKYTVSFNGNDIQSEAYYFSFGTTTNNHNFNNKFTGCTYEGTTYTSGLKMEATTLISWTSAGTGTTKVTIVQSDWSANTIKFDSTPLDINAAKIITGGRVYIVRNVSAGVQHSITQGSDESGIFYVSVEPDCDFYAYAPYNSSYVDLTDNKLSFDCTTSNTTDLLWADVSHTDYAISLDFRHALAKLSFGTITNNFGRDITLTGISVKARLYSSGNLSLADGTWSGWSAYDSEQTINREDFNSDEDDNKSLSVPIGSEVNINVDDILQIPGPTVTVTFTFTYTAEDNSTKTVTYSGDVVLEQGKNKVVSTTIGMNHEVVIQ